MREILHDERFDFKTYFDSTTGFYLRTDHLSGAKRGHDPFMASFPHMIDVGVMGHCKHAETGLCEAAGVDCYQSGMRCAQENMRLEDFASIVQQASGRCLQFALGGRGDPDQHEHFEDILRLCQENHIVPNFTTSGYGMTKDIAQLCKQYCGAVAVSWYGSQYTLSALQTLMQAGVKTNIHYVVSRQSIDEAIIRLHRDDFPKGINAVVFLLYKPVGQGDRRKVLRMREPTVEAFFHEVARPHPYKTGLDSCSASGVVHYAENVMSECMDSCEGARFSCYIGPDMTMLPCSFDQERRYAVDLSDGTTIEQAWNSEAFERFRDHFRQACPACPDYGRCMGGCPLMPQITLCNREERLYADSDLASAG